MCLSRRSHGTFTSKFWKTSSRCSTTHQARLPHRDIHERLADSPAKNLSTYFTPTRSPLRCIASPGLSENSAVLVPYRTWQAATPALRISADSSLPFFHSMSTSKPPRARRPLTEPSFHLSGSAGSKLISPAWLWTQRLGDGRREAEVGVGLIGPPVVHVGGQGIADESLHAGGRPCRPAPAVPTRRGPRRRAKPPPTRRVSIHACDRRRQVRVAAQGDGAAGIEREVGRDSCVPAARLPVLDPLLEMARAVDLVRRNPGQGGFQLAAEILVDAKQLLAAMQCGNNSRMMATSMVGEGERKTIWPLAS